MKKRNMLTTTYPNIFSKTLYFVHNNNGSAYLRSVLAGKYHKKYNLSLNFRHSFKSKGCPKFRLKDFPRQISTIFCYQSIKITWLLIIFIDFDFYLLTSLTNLGCNYTRNYIGTILKGVFPSTLSCYSIANKFTVCMNSVFSFWWTDVSSDINRGNRWKSRWIDEWNECIINFYRLINTININQIKFIDFYRLIDW